MALQKAMTRRFFLVAFILMFVLPACDSGGEAPTIDGDLAVSIEGPPNTEAQMTTVFFDEGERGNESETDITVPSSGEFEQDIEDGHDGVRVRVQVSQGTALVLTLLSNGAVFAQDDRPESLLDQALYEVEVGDVSSRPTPDSRE